MLTIEIIDGLTTVRSPAGDVWVFDNEQEAAIFVKAWFCDDVSDEALMQQGN